MLTQWKKRNKNKDYNIDYLPALIWVSGLQSTGKTSLIRNVITQFSNVINAVEVEIEGEVQNMNGNNTNDNNNLIMIFILSSRFYSSRYGLTMVYWELI